VVPADDYEYTTGNYVEHSCIKINRNLRIFERTPHGTG